MDEATRLVCGLCGSARDSDHWGPCECGGPLLAEYSLRDLSPEDLLERRDLWRYLPLLPVRPESVVTLGEGWTPLHQLRGIEAAGIDVFLKDEGLSPTGTFKARGMAVAVSKAVEMGVKRLAVPSAGNAGVALAAYAAAAGAEALVVLPEDTPTVLLREVVARGARCFLVRGSIDEAGISVREAEKLGYINLATLREPYRIEGKKTMGLEVWEQLERVPDWVIFPTGGGTGVVGLWKAFRELGLLGWSDGRLPRICVVQSTGCPPIARAWEGEEVEIDEPKTVAAGLRVPRPSGLRLILKVVRETRGLVMAVPEEEIPLAAGRMAVREGVYPCYEGAAAYLALERLLDEEHISKSDTVVVFNTGTGLINPGEEPPPIPVLDDPESLRGLLGR